MALHCEVFADVAVEPWLAESLRQLIARAAELEVRAPQGEWVLSIRLTDDEKMSVVHNKFFGNPDPTDVVSFPSGDDLSEGSGYLGDILISVDTAREQARLIGHTTEREVAFLALHGFLHLCGFDDRHDVDRTEMHRRQAELLDLAQESWDSTS